MLVTSKIRFNNLRGDIFGGVTAAVVSLPLTFGVGSIGGRDLAGLAQQGDALVMELTDVPLLGVTASPAIENVIQDSYDKGLQIYIVEASEKIQKRLHKLGLFEFVTAEPIMSDRTEALRHAVNLINKKVPLESY